MRKLKLQMQTTIDGFVAGPNGELDWMTWNWDDEIKDHVNKLHDPVDTILLGRKMTDGFVTYWESVLTNPADESYAFAKKMVETPKVVFSKTIKSSEWRNTELAGGDIVEEVDRLKALDGGDIIVYGGAGFVSSLINADLIDEYNFFVNPTAIGAGLTIFNGPAPKQLRLDSSTAFDCGVVHHSYSRVPAAADEK